MNAKQRFKELYREYRIAHNQTPIMSDAGIALRRQSVSKMREFTNNWVCPQFSSSWSIFGYKEKNKYTPSLAFRRWMKAN